MNITKKLQAVGSSKTVVIQLLADEKIMMNIYDYKKEKVNVIE